MEMAVGIGLQDLGDLLHGLHGAQLAVHQGDRHGDGVRAKQLLQVVQIDGAVPLDVHEVDLAALLLQGGQGAADGRMLQRGGDDVFANMAGQPRQTFERKVVGLAGPGGVDDLGRLHPQQLGDGLGGVVDLRFGSGPRLMVGVGVAGAAALYRAELCQHPLIDRGVGGIIQINHENPSIINDLSR